MDISGVITFIGSVAAVVGYIWAAFELVMAQAQWCNWIGWGMFSLYAIVLLWMETREEGDETAHYSRKKSGTSLFVVGLLTGLYLGDD